MSPSKGRVLLCNKDAELRALANQALTDFQTVMGENNLAKAFAFVTSRHPKLT